MIRAAIVGLGTWGQHLVAAVQGKSDAIRFVAGTTRTPGKAAEFCAHNRIRMADTYEELLKDSSIEAVVLATPHSAHPEQIIAAARAGKHVFVEKPLGLSRQESERAVAACAEHSVTLAVGYNWRFQPALREIRQMLDDGRLGKLLHIEGNFCGPSAYRFQPGHWRRDRDQVLYLAGHIDSVVAQSHRLVQDFGADDTTSMLFRFKSGATGYLGSVIATAETWRMQVFGSKGWAEVGGVEHLPTWELKVCFLDPSNIAMQQKPLLSSYESVSTERAELEHFALAAQEKRPLAVPGGDEVHNVAVLEGIVRSAQDGSRIRIA